MTSVSGTDEQAAVEAQWVVRVLEAHGSDPLQGSFSPIAYVRPFHGNQAWPAASGFLVHPRVVITAAHVVTRSDDHALWCATGILMHFGRSEIWGTRIALAKKYVSSVGGTSQRDIAVVRLVQAAARLEECFGLKPLEPELTATGHLWGWRGGELSSIPVEARRKERYVEYQAPDLEGMSGGPVVKDGTDDVLGMHRLHSYGRGQALPISIEEIRDAIVALGM